MTLERRMARIGAALALFFLGLLTLNAVVGQTLQGSLERVVAFGIPFLMAVGGAYLFLTALLPYQPYEIPYVRNVVLWGILLTVGALVVFLTPLKDPSFIQKNFVNAHAWLESQSIYRMMMKATMRGENPIHESDDWDDDDDFSNEDY